MSSPPHHPSTIHRYQDLGRRLLDLLVRTWQGRHLSGIASAAIRRFDPGRRYRSRSVDETTLISQALAFDARPGCMLEVGCLDGAFAFHLADHGWEVHAFEPDPRHRAAIRQEAASHRPITLVQHAVSDAVSTDQVFFTSTLSPGISSLAPFHASHRPHCRVDTTTLAIYCATNGIRAIDFLKIDAEGYDFMVLRGLDFSRIRPRVILCEFEDRKTAALGWRYRDLLGLLDQHGYHSIVSEWWPIQQYGRPHHWRRFILPQRHDPDSANWGNLMTFANAQDYHQMLTAITHRQSSPHPSR
jgi:FkbM family methyltransferase